MVSTSSTSAETPLRVAIPNKGSLSGPSAEILGEAGYRQRHDSRTLNVLDAEGGVEFFYLRPRDIALYVGEGTLDVGITGRDLLLDSGAKAEEVLGLGFGQSRFRFAAPPGTLPSMEKGASMEKEASLADLAGKRIATSYVGVVRRHLEERGVEAEVVRLDGAVETSIQLGVADVIADVVETGGTLKAAGLELVGDVILESEAVLVTRAGAELPDGFEVFKRRLDGVLVARGYLMMDYDMPSDRVEQAVALTPGLESPTVSPLHREGWVAVRAMVPREGSQQLMDDLYGIGARAILLTDIHACRL